MSNVHGLFGGSNDDKKRDDDDEDDDKRNNQYVGGVDARGGGSGLAVEAGGDNDIFRLAQAASANEEAPERRITMYRNGFVVDDGPYRRLDDPANAEFLKSLAEGRTPRELGVSGDTTVALVDKRTEDYVETFQSFSGQGTSLGSSQAASPTGVVLDPQQLQTHPQPTVDTSQPTTNIQVRLLNGQRRVVQVNLTMTVFDLGMLLVGPDAATVPFRLVSGFPPKPLETSQTIQEANLQGAQVSMQKA